MRFISFLVLRDGARTMCVGVCAVDPLGLDELTAVCEGACNERVANLPRALAGDALPVQQLCNVQWDIEKMGKGKYPKQRLKRRSPSRLASPTTYAATAAPLPPRPAASIPAATAPVKVILVGAREPHRMPIPFATGQAPRRSAEDNVGHV